MISIPIISDFDARGINRAQKEFAQLETVGQKAQFAIKKAAVPAAAALGAVVAVIGDSVKAAIEDEAAQASLARQIKASSGATDSQVASVEKYISSLAKSAAISDDEARPAFQKLIVATKDVTKATDLMNLATDVAAAGDERRPADPRRQPRASRPFASRQGPGEDRAAQGARNRKDEDLARLLHAIEADARRR